MQALGGKGYTITRLLRLGASGLPVALALFILVSASGPAVATTNPGPTSSHSLRCKQTINPTGSLTFSSWQFPDTLNPYQTSRLVSREVDNAIFDSLFQYDGRGNLIRQMATSIPTQQNGGISLDGKTVTIQLKNGLRWSDGAEITSADLKFGWKVGMDFATGPSCLGSCDLIYRIDTPRRYRAVLHLKRPYSSAIPDALPDLWPPVWKGAWNKNPHQAALKLGEDPGFNFESSHFPTDGAYRVSGVQARSKINLQPMRYYSDMTCGGSVRNLVFTSYRSKSSLAAAAASRQTDMTFDYDRSDVPDLTRHTAYKVQVRTSFSFEHLEFNIDKKYRGGLNPLSVKNVRLALALALDKYGLIRALLSVKQPLKVAAWSPFARVPDLIQPMVQRSPLGQWDPMSHKYVTSGTVTALADAKKILARTKFKRGFTLDFYTTAGSGLRLAEEGVIASSWSPLKVRLIPHYVSDSKLLGPWNAAGIASHGSFQVAMFAYLGSPDPDQLKFNLESRYCDRRDRFHSTINGNYSCIRDSLINKSFSLGSQSFNTAVRARSYSAVASEVNKEAYWVPLYFRSAVSTTDSRVLNFSDNPTALGPTWNIYAWRVRK